MGQIPRPDMWFISGRLPRMASERAVLNWRFPIGSGPSEFIWEFVSVGQIQKGLRGKNRNFWARLQMRWHGGILVVLVHKAHRGRGACHFKLVIASIDYPGQRQWSKHACVSSLTEVAIDQVKDLILPPIPVDFGVWLMVLQIRRSKFFYSQELTFKSHTLEVPTYP